MAALHLAGDKRRSLDEKDVRLAILAFLVKRREDKQPKATANAICRKAPEFQQNVQRNQRIQDHLEALFALEMVRKEELDTGTYWELTEYGYEWYKRISKELREFFYVFIPSK